MRVCRSWLHGSRAQARLGGRAVGRRCQLQLVPADVAPGAVLPADFAVDADQLEAEAFVQGLAGRIRQGDAGAGHAEATLAQALEEGSVEGAPDALAADLVAYVDGDRGAPAICGPLVEGGGVGVGDQLPVALGDEPGVAGAVALDPRRHLP